MKPCEATKRRAGAYRALFEKYRDLYRKKCDEAKRLSSAISRFPRLAD